MDGTSVGAVTSYTFSNVTAAHTIAASFVAKTYAIAASAGTNGAISPSGSVSVTHGASQVFTITANTGYQVQDVLVDGTSVGAVTSYTFSNVTAAHTIAASFVAKTYAIAASAGTNGAISPSGSVSVITRRQPGVYDHGKHRLSGTGCPGGWHIGWSGDFLYLLQCHGRSHHFAASFIAKTYAIALRPGANGGSTARPAAFRYHKAAARFLPSRQTPATGAGCLVDGVFGWSWWSVYTFSK